MRDLGRFARRCLALVALAMVGVVVGPARRLRTGDGRSLHSVVATVALVAVAILGAYLAVVILDAPRELWSTEPMPRGPGPAGSETHLHPVASGEGCRVR